LLQNIEIHNLEPDQIYTESTLNEKLIMTQVGDFFRRHSYFKLISIALYVAGGLCIVLAGVALGLTLAFDEIFYHYDCDVFDEDQYPIGGLLAGFAALLTAGMISGLLSCGATQRQISKVLYPVLVIGIELCFIGLAIDIHYLTLTGIGTVEYALKDNAYDEDDAYNKNENLLHYLRVALGISGTSTWLSLTILVALCITTSVAGKRLLVSKKPVRINRSDDDDVPLLGSEQRRNDRIQMGTFKKIQLLSLAVSAIFFGIAGLVLAELDCYYCDVVPVGFVWALTTLPMCVLLLNSKRCLREETWTLSCYICGVISCLMTFAGFVYEIVATIYTIGDGRLDSIPAIVFVGSQIYVIAALLGSFILSIYVCLKLQSAVWKSCLINSDESDADADDQLHDIQNAIQQPPQISLRSNDIRIAQNGTIANESTFNGTPATIHEIENLDDSSPGTTVQTNIYYGAPFLDQ
jgi:hypothetical protein